MALLLMESFDTYATGNYTGKWASQGGTIGAVGREGTNGISHTTEMWMQRAVSNKQTLIVGIAIKLSTTKSWNLLEFRDSTTNQIGLFTDASNQIIIKRGSTTLENTGYAIPTGSWIYLEFKATIHNSTGSYELRINGDTKASASGVDTQQTGNAYATSVLFRFSGIGASTHYLDDIYIFDDSGSFCNDFVGDVHVEALFPDGVGYVTQWVPQPAGSDNYEHVNETDPDGDTTFVATSGVGYLDSYDFGTLVALSGSVYGLQVNAWARKDDVGSRTLNVITRPTTVTYSGDAPISLGNTYGYNIFHFETNPETATFWTIAEINDAEFGIKQEA
jgi:hypothetical protein